MVKNKDFIIVVIVVIVAILMVTIVFLNQRDSGNIGGMARMQGSRELIYQQGVYCPLECTNCVGGRMDCYNPCERRWYRDLRCS